MESLIRGGPPMKLESEKQFVLDVGIQILDFVTSKNMKSYAMKCEKQTIDLYSTLAVKMYNKVRNLVHESYSEIRSIYKAASGWILLYFTPAAATKSSNGFYKLIKLLTRANQELQMIEKTKPYGVHCAMKVVELWKNSDLTAMSLTLPPIELNEIKVSVFQAYLDATKYSTNNVEKRSCILSSLELIQTLSKGLKISFINSVMNIAANLTDEKAYVESIEMFRIAIQVLDSILLQIMPTNRSTSSTAAAPSTVTAAASATLYERNKQALINEGSDEDGGETIQDDTVIDIIKAKVKSQLSIAYIYSEMK